MDRDNNIRNHNKNNTEERHLRFVLRYYAPGLFDTRRAIRAYNLSHRVASALRHRYYAIAGIAASVAICIILGYYWLSDQPNSVTTLYAEGQDVTYTLPDGSTVILSPNSTLTYTSATFGEGERHVDMTGKIEFKVSRDTLSPFIASASRGLVRVLGTQFTIDCINPDSITISVTSGKVLFSEADRASGVILTKGMHACLTAGDSIPEIATDTVTATPYLRGKLIFDNTPLPEVLESLSAHFHVNLSSTASDRTLSAEFDPKDGIDNIIMLIEKSLNVTITKTPDTQQ